jgi:release factor glutamine methyltransferase
MMLAAATGLTLDAAMTRAEALARVAVYLAHHDVEEARGDARALLLAAAALSRADFMLAPDAALGADAAARLSAFAWRRAEREPASRIIGERGFWTLDLAIAPDVLDPRADTETLVELASSLLRARRGEALTILDLGSGSGAILCALLAEFPQTRGVAVDLSPAACAATRANLARCGFAHRASVLRGRWAEALAARFDLLVSNPPYIRHGDIAALDPEVRLHDPALALDGGVDGLACYRVLALAAPALLAPEGVALFEVGAGQSGEVAALLRAQGLPILGTAHDTGGHERVVAAGARAGQETVTN